MRSTPHNMAFLNNNDIDELSSAWNRRRDDAFRDAIEDDFVHMMLQHVPDNLKEQLLWAIQHATAPVQLQVAFSVQFDRDHAFTAEGWGTRKLSIRQVIYNTNALARIARSIGPNIKVSHRFARNSVFFTIDFWPTRAYPHVVHNPEDEYADMPHLEGYPPS